MTMTFLESGTSLTALTTWIDFTCEHFMQQNKHILDPEESQKTHNTSSVERYAQRVLGRRGTAHTCFVEEGISDTVWIPSPQNYSSFTEMRLHLYTINTESFILRLMKGTCTL